MTNQEKRLRKRIRQEAIVLATMFVIGYAAVWAAAYIAVNM